MVASHNQISGLDSETEQRHILKLSHGVAVVLLFSEFDLPHNPTPKLVD